MKTTLELVHIAQLLRQYEVNLCGWRHKPLIKAAISHIGAVSGVAVMPQATHSSPSGSEAEWRWDGSQPATFCLRFSVRQITKMGLKASLKVGRVITI